MDPLRWSEMSSFKGTSVDDRLRTAANAKKAELEKFRARSGTNDPAFVERQAARRAISVARDARTAERSASRLADSVERSRPWRVPLGKGPRMIASSYL